MTLQRLTTTLALGLACATGCKQSTTQPAPQAQAATPAGQPATTPTPAPAPTPKSPMGDPTGGKFSLEEATAGLEGSGPIMARVKTSQGQIECELFPDKAPVTVASFVGLARGARPFKDPKTGEWVKRPYFDGTAFHRVIPEFMIQGGDVLSLEYSNRRIGSGGPGYSVPDEIAPDLKFDKPGRLAMANSGPGTNSGGSQFFITEVPRPMLDGGYVIFGQCGNADVVQKIARVAKEAGGEGSRPAEALTMQIEIFRK